MSAERDGSGRDYGRPWLAVGWSGGYLLVSRLAALAAVPILFSALGTDLYAAWVLAGSLVMAQGLADLGMGAALVRFVSETSSRGFGRGARSAAERGMLFFAGLGVVGAVPLLVLAEPIARAATFESSAAEAAVLLRYAGVAFLLTNLTMSLASVLQGLNQVDVSFRAQTLSWLVYIPVLAAATDLWSAVHGAGVAWLVTYGLQLLLLLPPCIRGLRSLPAGNGTVPHLGDMLSFGGRWQVSSWADFATFQLPRILGAFLLTSSAVVSVDLALRFGQAAVAPLFAVYPILLPAFSRILARAGFAGLRDALLTWYTSGLACVGMGLAVVLPLSVPAIATWIGQPISDVDAVVSTTVLVGVVAHASTGLFTNAWLALGKLSAVILYKAWQLGAGAILVTLGALMGPRELGVGLAIALTVPAVRFNISSASALQVRLELGRPWARRVAVAAATGFVATLLVVLVSSSFASAWLVFLAGCVTALATLLVGVQLVRDQLVTPPRQPA